MVSTLILLGVTGVQAFGIYKLRALVTGSALGQALRGALGANRSQSAITLATAILAAAVGLRFLAHFIGAFSLLIAPLQWLLSPFYLLALVAGVLACINAYIRYRAR